MLRYLAIALFIFASLVPVAAQEDVETIPLSGALNITVPKAWTIVLQNGTGYVWETDSSRIRIRTYSSYHQAIWDFEGTPSSTLEFMALDVLGNRDFDQELIETAQFGNYEGQSYLFEELSQGMRYQRQLFAYINELDFAVVGHLMPIEGHDLNPDDVEAVQTALGTVTTQDHYVLYEGTTLEIPEGWQLGSDDNYGIAELMITNGTLDVYITYWPRYGLIAGFANPLDFLGYIWEYNYNHNGRYDRTRAETTQAAGYDAILYPFDMQTLNSLDRFDRALIIFRLSGTTDSYITAQVMSTTLDDDINPVYEVLDTVQPGARLVCPLFADPDVRIRSEPTTNSDVVRQTDDETLIAVRQTTGSDGFTWFDIREGWIRSDVVFYERNTCEDIPALP